MDSIKIILFLVSMTFSIIALMIGYFVGSGILKIDVVVTMVIFGFLFYLALNYFCSSMLEHREEY